MSNKTFTFSLLGLLVAWLISICSIVGISNHNSKHVVLETKVVEVELLAINPPKHVYVDIKDLDTGTVWRKVFVSKHYNRWRELKIGDKFRATRITRKMINQDNKIDVDWEDLRSGLDQTLK